MRAGEPDRAAGIDHRWRRATWRVHERIWWRWWNVADASYLTGAFFIVLSMFAEPALWPLEWAPPVPLQAVLLDLGPPVSLALLLLLPLAGWVLDGALALQDPPGVVPRRWLRGVRFLGATLPLVNLYAGPLWRRLAEERPAWAFTAELVHPLVLRPVGGPRPAVGWLSPRRAWHRRFVGSGWPLVALVMTLLPPLWWTVSLAAAHAAGDRLALLLFVASLHVAAALALHGSLRPRLTTLSGGQALGARLLPWLCLLPLPLNLAGFLGLELARLSPGQTTAIDGIYRQREQMSQQPSWREVQAAVHQSWRRLPWWRRRFGRAGDQPAPVAGKAIRQRQAFYRLKTLLLVLDVAALVVMLARLAERWPAATPACGAVLRGAVVLSISLGAIGLLVQGVALGARLTRSWDLARRLDRRPWGRYLLLTQLAVLAGIDAGHWLAHGQVEVLLWFSLSSTVVAMLAVPFNILLSLGGPPRDNDPLVLLWPILFVVLGLAGALSLVDEEIRTDLRRLLCIALALLPLWHLGLAATAGSWMLDPYRWRDLLARQLPREVCRRLVFLGFVVCLPFGGALLPGAIVLGGRLGGRSL